MVRRVSRSLLPSVALVVALAACGPGQTGDPCSEDGDCAETLTCDVHDGEGTCQEAHSHDE